DGHPKGNSVVANMIHDNTEDGLKATDADDNTFTGNAYAANGEMVLLQRGLRNRFDGDTMPDDGSITAEDNSSTFVSHQASTRIALDPTSVVVFDDERGAVFQPDQRSEEHTSELQSRFDLVCRLLLEKKKRREVDDDLHTHHH